MRGVFIKYLLLSLIAVQSSYALYGSRDHVIEVDHKNFDAEVMKNDRLAIVEFYAPWCGYCKQLAPEYKKVAENLKGLVKVVAVNCDDESNRPICGRHGVQGFPTIKVFKPDVKNPDKPKIPYDYQGQRTAKPIVDYLLTKMPSYVQRVREQNSDRAISLEEFYKKENTTLSKALLFTTKDRTTPLYKGLSAEFKDRILLGEVVSTEREVVAKLGVEKFPTLLVFPKGKDGEVVTYDGKLNYESLHEFLSKYALPAKITKKSEDSSSKRPESTPKAEPFNPEIGQIRTQKELESECLSKTGICIFTFLNMVEEDPIAKKTGEEALSLLRELKEHHHKKGSPFRFAWMDAQQEAVRDFMKDFDVVADYPSMLALNPNRRGYRNFLGAFEKVPVERFLDEIISGRGRVVGYQFEPKLSGKKVRDEL
ncbi:uncharacterized protein VTP21DRAFT_9999 [Calcarisporiella thermophila]|uniref:uncharacterized protein n=1 Tax=Calcarisporiella thermophila TaxID=911321 RepID=UPI00374456F1